MAVRRKKTRAIRRVNEWDEVPFDKGWHAGQYYIHYYIDSKKWGDRVNQYIRKHYDKSIVSAINKLPEWKIGGKSHWATAAVFEENAPDKIHPDYVGALDRFINEMAAEGEKIISERKEKIREAKRVPPSIRLRDKTYETIMIDLDNLEDGWCSGDYKQKVDVYKLFSKYELKGAIPAQLVLKWAEDRMVDFVCARDKTDEQCVEAYAHLSKRDLNSVIKTLEEIVSGTKSFQAATKAKRSPRKKKVKSADDQVKRLQYKREDSNYKIASIDPAVIVGAMRVYIFNTKSRELIEYVSYRREGFEVKGTTILHFEPSDSRKIKLRKPEEILPKVLTSTPKQVDNIWKKLTSKTSEVTGRINNEMIIMKAMDK